MRFRNPLKSLNLNGAPRVAGLSLAKRRAFL
jgi:hypothetical protein